MMRLPILTALVAVLVAIPSAGIAHAAALTEPTPGDARVEPPARPDDPPASSGPPAEESTVLEGQQAPSSADRSLAPGLQATPLANRVVGTVLAAGGASVVGERTLAQVASVSDRAAARSAGADRYATAVALSVAHFPGGADDVWLATGQDFPDGITASAVAGARGGPVLLTPAATVPANVIAELVRLAPMRVWIVGGTGVLSENAVTMVRGALPGVEVARLAGPDRYATSAALAEAFVDSADTVFIASGLDFPDALSTGPAASERAAPTLLVSRTAVPAATEAQLRRLHPATVHVIGGTGVVADAVLARIRSITGAEVDRVAGPDRFATAAAVADRFLAPTTASVVLANAFSFADGISAGAVAGALQSPLLLADGGTAPPRVTVDAARRVSWWLPDSGRVLRYTLVTHPDDEFAAWSVLGQRDPRRYDVLVVLTAGESTAYCTGRPVVNPWAGEQYVPQPQPTGEAYSDRCKDQRMDSWRVFVESAGFVGADETREGTGQPIEFDGRVLPVPQTRDEAGTVVESPGYDLAVGPDHAVVAFDMGALTSDEVLWAIQTTRGLAAEFPTQVEGDILGAGFVNDGPTGYVNRHPDHTTVQNLLGTIDLGLPGSQYATVGHAQPGRAFGATVGDYCGMMCHPAAPIPFRGAMGRFQYAYGWLADGYWAPGEVDQPSGFSRYQSFSKWF